MHVGENERMRNVFRSVQIMICIWLGLRLGFYIMEEISHLEIGVNLKLLIYLVFVVVGGIGLFMSGIHLLKNCDLYNKFSLDWTIVKSSLAIFSLIFCFLLLIFSLIGISWYIFTLLFFGFY